MKIVFFETMPEERTLLEEQLPDGHDVHFLEEPLAETTTAKAADADIVSVFVQSRVNAAVIDTLSQTKFITTRSVGYDHIDVEHARTKGIKVINVTTYASHPVAEFTFALLLNVTRRICAGAEQSRTEEAKDIIGLKGVNLFGKTLGVVGTGRIGRNVITIAKGFGMTVLASDTKPDEAFAAQQQFCYVPLEELVAASDIITLHAPYLKETHHLINADTFARMKKGAILINTARGELIDTHALAAALRDGTLWGAGVDVLERTEPELNRVLVAMPNVIATPHVAFETVEALEEIDRATAVSIQNFITGTEQPYV